MASETPYKSSKISQTFWRVIPAIIRDPNLKFLHFREKPKKKKTEIEEPEIKKIKPSIEGSTEAVQDKNEAIAKLLRSTEKQKRRLEKRKKEKRAKSVFHNA